MRVGRPCRGTVANVTILRRTLAANRSHGTIRRVSDEHNDHPSRNAGHVRFAATASEATPTMHRRPVTTRLQATIAPPRKTRASCATGFASAGAALLTNTGGAGATRGDRGSAGVSRSRGCHSKATELAWEWSGGLVSQRPVRRRLGGHTTGQALRPGSHRSRTGHASPAPVGRRHPWLPAWCCRRRALRN